MNIFTNAEIAYIASCHFQGGEPELPFSQLEMQDKLRWKAIADALNPAPKQGGPPA